MKDQKNKIKVGFTTGDMNGIGPEILLKSLKNTELLSLCTPVIYGSLQNLDYTLNHLGFELSFNRISSSEQSKEVLYPYIFFPLIELSPKEHFIIDD